MRARILRGVAAASLMLALADTAPVLADTIEAALVAEELARLAE